MAQERQAVDPQSRPDTRPTDTTSPSSTDRGSTPLPTPEDRRLQADLLLAERRRDARRNARRGQ